MTINNIELMEVRDLIEQLKRFSPTAKVKIRATDAHHAHHAQHTVYVISLSAKGENVTIHAEN